LDNQHAKLEKETNELGIRGEAFARRVPEYDQDEAKDKFR